MTITRFNSTRTSASIPRRLLSERKAHLVPLYYLLQLSALGREGIENSGSFRFADHIYVGRSRGTFPAGKILDRLLLSLPSARSFRNRFLHVKEQLRRLERAGGELRILSVPSGIPRDLIEVARECDLGSLYCLDADPDPLEIGRTLARSAGVIENFTFLTGDAFDAAAWPDQLDAVSSTGLGEFLSDQQLSAFYSLAYEKLRMGGVLITSATLRHRFSAFLMEQLAELRAHYRDGSAMQVIFRATPFRKVEMTLDPIGYQLLITATKTDPESLHYT